MKIFIPIHPIPKGRPRLGKHGAYTPESTRKCEREIRQNLIGWKPLTGAVVVSLKFFFDKEPRGDLDNYVKLVTDSMNGFAYVDDKQIYQLVAEKCKGTIEGIFIQVEAIK